MNMVKPQKGKILSVSLAHLLNDWYMNYIQTLLPFMVAAGLSVSKGAFLVSAFSVTSSLLQPVTGYLVDQKNQRWPVYLGTLWMAVLLSLVGLLKSYPLLFLTVALAGIGTAAFHPQASAMVTAVSGEKKGFFQAFFITCGNMGWALTPLIVVPFTQQYGMELTPLFVLPGIMVALLLWFTAPTVATPARKAPPPPLLSVLRPVWAELTKVVLVVAFRSLTYFTLVAFLPLYLLHRNVQLITGSRILFVMLSAGAIGGLAGGYLSDLFGRKSVIVGSLVLTSPLFYIFLNTNGSPSYLLLALAGAALLASFSVTVVVAQEVISKNAAMAAGLMLGFGIGIGGLGVGLMGILVEHVGIDLAMNMLVWLPLLAGILGLSLSGKKAQAASGAANRPGAHPETHRS
jgi:MFS transporter, FSR family, fosmidomycin resistance protein